ncbi:MAG TPA: GMC family oxidoreductase [Gemmatimonadaceae bacterium]|nr:GMC family oxidoreductase [Gemmatimonadaceae bacterium]
MHTDAQLLENGSLIEGDLCIVGAGAAGISLALEWVGSGRKVLLLEGGGFELDLRMQDLYRGEVVGQPYFPLEAARLHYFGGTTNHWAGLCAPFDPIDFEKRDWVPHSGWPIDRADLDPFYARAQQVLDLGPYEYGADHWGRQDGGRTRLPLDQEVVWTKMWQLSPPTRFGKKYRDAIVGARDVHLYTHANVVEVEATEGVRAASGLRVRTLDGKEHRVRARRYVLACCSIQNARLLLASNRQARHGLGNAHDQVGRYFMEHIEMPAGELALETAHLGNVGLYRLDYGKTKARGELSLSAAAQRRHRVLNGTTSLQPLIDSAELQSTFQMLTPEVLDAWVRAERGDTTGMPVLRKAMANFRPLEPGERTFRLFSRQEQAPNPASRVTLGTERDAMGMPRVRFDWRLTELDKRSMRTFYEVLGREMGKQGAGRVQVLEWLRDDDATWPGFLSGGWHHMGTTRMHRDPKRGVVDANCRVHGLANLYVAGASVYPTSSAANPTLTLVALTLRLADHLKASEA